MIHMILLVLLGPTLAIAGTINPKWQIYHDLSSIPISKQLSSNQRSPGYDEHFDILSICQVSNLWGGSYFPGTLRNGGSVFFFPLAGACGAIVRTWTWNHPVNRSSVGLWQETLGTLRFASSVKKVGMQNGPRPWASLGMSLGWAWDDLMVMQQRMDICQQDLIRSISRYKSNK